jgi:hypothetical protein
VRLGVALVGAKSAALAAQGRVTGSGKPHVASAVATMLGSERASQRPRIARYARIGVV